MSLKSHNEREDKQARLMSTEDSQEIFESIYEEIIHFTSQNLFIPPTGNSLKKMIEEMTSLLLNYVTDAPGKHMSLKMLMCMPKLLLQKPHSMSKTKENNEAFKRRMKTWVEGNYEDLLNEAKDIQKRQKKMAEDKSRV